MLSLVDKTSEMESNPSKINNNSHEAAELLGLSSSDSLDSPSFSHFQAPKQKRKVRFKKPFRPSSRLKSGRSNSSKSYNCRILDFAKILSVFSLLAIVGALMWYVMSLSTRIQELQDKFADIEAGNRNTPEALHVIHSKLKQLDSNVTMLYIEVRKNIADIDNITCEVKNLKDVTNNLKESIAAAPAIQELPKSVHSLSESVVSFGSKINALESNVKELKDQQSTVQTTAQNLSGELDSLKIMVQELVNSSDTQSKLFGNTSSKDLKNQNAQQEIIQAVHILEGKLLHVTESLDNLNSSLSNQLNSYSELPSKVETINDAIVWLVNDSHSHSSQMSNLENFIHSNLTLHLEQLEFSKGHRLSGPDVDSSLNKTVFETILNLINSGVFHTDIPSSKNNSLQALEQTHDVLVLLAALLRKFEQIPNAQFLSNENATHLVKNMLQQAFEELMTSRDLKIDEVEREVKKLNSLCIPKSEDHRDNGGNSASEALTAPTFVQPSPVKAAATSEQSHTRIPSVN